MWRLRGVLWAFTHILKCRRTYLSALSPVRYTGVMTERWMIGRVRIIRYPLRRQQMRGWTWVKDDSRTVFEVFNGRTMWVFEVLPK